MYLTIIVLITILCVLLVLVVLAQNPKGGGLSSEFGGGSSSQMMGVKRTTDLLEKLTWGFAIGILVLSLGANLVLPRSSSYNEEGPTSKNIEKAKEIQTQAPTAQPAATENSEEGTLDLAPTEEEN